MTPVLETPKSAVGEQQQMQYTLEDFVDSGHECPTCGRDDFSSEYGLKQHHAKVHGTSLTETFICEVCGHEEEMLPSEADKKRFCSNECMGEKFSEEKSKKVVKPCEVCGTDVERCRSHIPENGPFCSRGCYHEWREGRFTGEDNWGYNSVEVECSQCGKAFERQPAKVGRAENPLCSQSCRSDWMEERPPQEHPRWSGGQSVYVSVRRYIAGEPWTVCRDIAREEAEECEMCGITPEELDSNLDIHHIIPILCGGCNSQELLMGLCRQCHRKAEAYTRSIPEIEPVLIE